MIGWFLAGAVSGGVAGAIAGYALGYLVGLERPETGNQFNEIKEHLMSVDNVLHKVADKLDAARDRILGELDRLEAEAKKGRPSPEVMRRIRQSVEAIHGIVPEAEHEDAEEEAEHEDETEHDEHGHHHDE